MKGSEEFKVIFLSVSMVGEKIFPENRFLRFLKCPHSNYQIPSSSSSESYTVPYVIENAPRAASGYRHNTGVLGLLPIPLGS